MDSPDPFKRTIPDATMQHGQPTPQQSRDNYDPYHPNPNQPSLSSVPTNSSLPGTNAFFHHTRFAKFPGQENAYMSSPTPTMSALARTLPSVTSPQPTVNPYDEDAELEREFKRQQIQQSKAATARMQAETERMQAEIELMQAETAQVSRTGHRYGRTTVDGGAIAFCGNVLGKNTCSSMNRSHVYEEVIGTNGGVVRNGDTSSEDFLEFWRQRSPPPNVVPPANPQSRYRGTRH